MEWFNQWLQGFNHLYTETDHNSAGEQCASTPHAPQLGLTQVEITKTTTTVSRKVFQLIQLKKLRKKEKHLRIFFCRTNWIKAVQMCSKAREFALALAILECAIKPVAMLPVWKDSLGHTRYTLEHYMGLTQSNTSGKYKTQKTINKA